MANDLFPNLLFPTCAECAGIDMHVPEMLWDIEDECGFDVLKPFLLEYAGRELRVTPKDAHDYSDDPVAVVKRHLSFALGQRLKITVPQGPASREARLRWTIHQALRQGQSLNTISKRTG
ncbi:hypothetical protein E7811_16675 [Aliigemmobacter aestuarii]|uniref:Uncharacterized protein n=1 Tax=Aliigemmobacter aestuarii TaxID=1445661 RepID=A0A4S3MJD4_9RHOB|nr:hypothetical protein [Gemmobacter aestuarii]THD81539.1 hypothetical protein E7811_16675 [Gemmobacter aestuarii]